MHWCYSIKAFARAETVERIHSVSNGLQEMGMLENKGFIWGFKPTTYVIVLSEGLDHTLFLDKREWIIKITPFLLDFFRIR